MPTPHLPAVRLGVPYVSLDRIELLDFRHGATAAWVSQVSGGMIRRDLVKLPAARAALARKTAAEMLGICARAGELFMTGRLPCGTDGLLQSADDYVAQLSSTTALPYRLCRVNMAKLGFVCANMKQILDGLMRGLDPACIDHPFQTRQGSPMCFFPATNALGAVLPSNSPGVHSLWLPALALKIAVVLKPGREEPWTPYRLMQAFLAAGCPAEAFSFYPVDHEGAEAIARGCGRVLIFGDATTTSRYVNDPRVQAHGPGHSKVVIGPDVIDRWPEFIDVLAVSIAENGGRSCVNASAVIVPRHGEAIADALGRRLGPIEPHATTHPEAVLAGFANPRMVELIDEAIEEGLKTPGAKECTAPHRNSPRRVEFEGGSYLRPTVIYCQSLTHPLAQREFLFPYASVVEVPADRLPEALGATLVATLISDDEDLRARFVNSPCVNRLNLGTIPTCRVQWDQPHEGNLFEFLYQRRALQVAPVRASNELLASR